MLLNTPICDFDWDAPAFSLETPDNEAFTLDDLMGANGLLIAFICNHCPYVKAIIDRLVDDVRTLEKHGVNAVAIMPNDYQNYPDDHPDKMKEFARLHNFSFPYLVDHTQDVAKAYNAICTPDFFGINTHRKLQYRGRLDDAKMGPAENRRPELLDAMQMVAETGKGPIEQTPSMGCSIKWK